MELRFYKTRGGNEPVREHLRELPKEDRALIGAELRMVQEHGLAESDVEARRIRGKLWELKIDAHRIFYVVIVGPVMVLLHAYRKQSQKAPKADIEVAEQRMGEVFEQAKER